MVWCEDVSGESPVSAKPRTAGRRGGGGGRREDRPQSRRRLAGAHARSFFLLGGSSASDSGAGVGAPVERRHGAALGVG
uniref:Uncharacterized protein n=1 Tax=Gasterosteus aculeatus TaxID=69293 RepID=G3NYC0_GASAC